MNKLLECRDIRKVYREGSLDTEVLKGVSLISIKVSSFLLLAHRAQVRVRCFISLAHWTTQRKVKWIF